MISSQLYLFESQLRHSQKQLRQELYIRDELIKQQQKQISKLQKECQLLQFQPKQTQQKTLKKPTTLGVRSHSSNCLTVNRTEQNNVQAPVSPCLQTNETIPFMNPIPLRNLVIKTDLVEASLHMGAGICGKNKKLQHPLSPRPIKSSSLKPSRKPLIKQKSEHRFNSFLRKPEILETVYSVEDPDSDGEEKTVPILVGGLLTDVESDFSEPEGSSSHRTSVHSLESSKVHRANSFKGIIKYCKRITRSSLSDSRSSLDPNDETSIKVDDKFKAFNKGKSKSVEELRGRLKNLVDITRKYSYGSTSKSTE